MKILFLHGWHSVPGGVKPSYLAEKGHEVINPALDDDDFDAAVRTAQAECDRHRPDVIVGSSRGGAVAMNIETADTPLVLLCPAWKRWGTVRSVKPGTVILHSRADEVIPFADSVELVEASDLPAGALIEVGNDHRLADSESLDAMLEAIIDVCVPEWTDDEEELLEQEWSGLCYTASMRWATVATSVDCVVVHGTVWSGRIGKRIEHAWCEYGETVVDLVMPVGHRIIEREQYYRVVKPSIRNAYTSEEALILSAKSGHDGPWGDP